MTPIRPIPICFAEIRKKLNPAYSYLIFEDERGVLNKEYFSGIETILARHPKKVRGREFYREKNAQKIFLVAEIEPDHGETIKDQILNTNLPKTMTVYFYRRNRLVCSHSAEKC